MDSEGRGKYPQCGSCNCFPGYCEAAERNGYDLVAASIQNALEGRGGYRVDPEGPLPIPVRKNRSQRRREARLLRRGASGKGSR